MNVQPLAVLVPVKHGRACAAQSRELLVTPPLEAALDEPSRELALDVDSPTDVELPPPDEETPPALLLVELEDTAPPLEEDAVTPVESTPVLLDNVSWLLLPPALFSTLLLDRPALELPVMMMNPLEVAAPELAPPLVGRHTSDKQARSWGQVMFPPQVNRHTPPTQRCPLVHTSLPPQASSAGLGSQPHSAHSSAKMANPTRWSTGGPITPRIQREQMTPSTGDASPQL